MCEPSHDLAASESAKVAANAVIREQIGIDREIGAQGAHVLRWWLNAVVSKKLGGRSINRLPRVFRLPELIMEYIGPIFCEKPCNRRVLAKADGSLYCVSNPRGIPREGALLLPALISEPDPVPCAIAAA